MKVCTPAFTTEKNKSGNSPRTLLVFNFPAPTGQVFVSDGPWNTGAQVYRPLVMSWQPIYKQVNPDPLTFDTADWKLTLANTEATPFSAYFAQYDPLAVQVDVYHWFDGLVDSDKLLIDSFVVSDVLDYDSEKIELDLVSLIEKYENQVGSPINATTYPYADPDAFNHVEPIVYGIVNQLPIPCIRAGGYSTITDDPLTAAATAVHVSLAVGDAPFPAAPFDALIDAEQVHVSAVNGSIWTIARGQGGTTAAAHLKGTPTREKRNDFTFIAAGHPISSIDGIFVKVNGRFVKLTAGYTLYTGQPGSQHPTWPNKAVVVLSSDWARLNSQAVTSSQAISDPTHTHGLSGSSQTVYPNSASASGSYANPTYAIDGNDTSSCTLNNPTMGAILSIGFPSTNYGTIVTQYLYITAVSTTLTIGGGWSPSTAGAGSKSTVRLQKSGGNWADGCTIQSDTIYGSIYEVWKVVVYTPTASNAATGVGLTGSVGLSGNSAVDSVLYDGQLYISMHGYKDDGSGTYTGTPNALIQNPVNVIAHFIQNYGAPAGCCDAASFAAAASSCASAIAGGYLFALALTKAVSFKAMIARLAFQCRTRIWMEGMNFRAKFRSLTPTASVKTVTTVMMGFRSVKVSLTAKDEIVDDMKLSYNPDWGKGEPSVGNCLNICDQSATYPLNNGIHRKTQWELMECVYLPAMASDLRDFYIGQYKARKRRIDWSGFTQCMDVERYDMLALNHDAPVFSFESLLTETENLKYYPGSGKSKRGHRTEFTSRADFTGWDAVADFDSVSDVDAIK